MQLSDLTAGWRNEDKIAAAPSLTATVDGNTSILIAYGGKPSELPAQWLYKRGVDYINPFTDEQMAFTNAGATNMVRIFTNYAPGHTLTVAPETMLALWGGGTVRADSAEGKQLRGRSGMYVVQSVNSVDVQAYQIKNISTAEGIYLW